LREFLASEWGILPAMRAASCLIALYLLTAGKMAAQAKPPDPPVIPVGLDAYRLWDRWPYQRIGARAYMRSTYDRRGGNEGADASHFLYQLSDDFNTALDVEGPGILYFARYNHWHGSPWHYVVDGAGHIIRESSTADPLHPVENSIFLPERLFPNPLTWTWSITQGADLMWVPIPFERSFQMAYSRTHYGTGYFIYHQYVRGANLSRPIRTWDTQSPPDAELLALVGRAGTDLAPRAGTPQGIGLGVEERRGEVTIPGHGSVLLTRIARAPSMLRALEISLPRKNAVDLSSARLRVVWDGRPAPSIDAPLALFFGAGTFYNRDGREYLVKAFPVFVRFDAERVHLACFFPMPFFDSARLELVGAGGGDVSGIRWAVRYVPYKEPPSHAAYFHATYRDHSSPEPGRDLLLLDTRETEGGGDWSGHLVGTSFIFSHRGVLDTLEGDPRFYFDDSLTPQAQGTGTEEWGGGGDYWGGRNMTLPFAGHPAGALSEKDAKNEQDKIESAYRFLLADLMPFGRNARITLEHGGTNESTEHYETVTYWYGAPRATLVKTDELVIADPASEKAHGYSSPDASAPYEISSRYEWGVDTLDGREIFPPHTDRGRHTKGTSEFTMRIDPRNLGVLLRRKLDYSFPNQRAEVYIADVHAGKPQWKPAGIWYLAGSNTCVYSNPEEELGETQHIVETSNRRFRDDEFLIPRDLTEGRSAIRVRIHFTPVNRPLFPGYPIPELAWSEIHYTSYSFVLQ
jgi:D-arabinan exo alpha-(1,3)/(1,5)-arabinofuranosidase (non-reducing end)